MMKIVVCDDDKCWLEHASDLLREFCGCEGIEAEVHLCCSPSEIPDITPEPDLIFMDIEFESTPSETGHSGRKAVPDGIDAVKELNYLYPDCRIVYLTNHLNYALDVYQTQHIWYVVKEQFENRLSELFAKLTQMDAENKSVLVVREADGTQSRILCSDIRYMERKDRRTIIKTDSGDHIVHQRIPEIEGKLPGNSFGRCHTSFIVNFEKVASIGEKSLRIDDGTEILISRGYGRSFRLKYMEWAGSRSVR